MSMSESDETAKNLDPITKLSVEVDKLKARLDESDKTLAVKNKQLDDMMNANKRLVAELANSQLRNSSTPGTNNYNPNAYSDIVKRMKDR